MPEYQQYSNSSWERTAHTTLVEHIREVEECAMRNHPLFALLNANGRIEYNCGGSGFDWPVRYRNHQVESQNGETPRNFVRRNLWQTAALEYRGYQATDQMYKKEFKENRGPEAIVKVFDKMGSRLEESLNHALATEVFVDGNATGNENSWHGFESMFGINGTVNATTGAQRSANAADIVGYPSDTYAGLSTELGNYGGSNSSGAIWPNGDASLEYDFWTPLIVNYLSTHADMPSATNTWAGQGDEAMRYGILHSQRNATKDGQLDVIFLARDLYLAFLNLIDGKEQINVNGGGTTQLRALGFKNVVMFDGIEITWDTAITPAVGYGLNIQNTTMRCMDERMFDVEGPEWDIDDACWKIVAGTLSNLKFKSPRNYLKFSGIA